MIGQSLPARGRNPTKEGEDVPTSSGIRGAGRCPDDHRAGGRRPVGEAHEYALEYAQAAGLTLGSVISVTDVQTNGPFYGPGFFYGPFGPNQYCGELTQPIFKVVAGKRKVTGSKRVHRCFVPRFEPVSLSVTYSAT